LIWSLIFFIRTVWWRYTAWGCYNWCWFLWSHWKSWKRGFNLESWRWSLWNCNWSCVCE
jgi:hypothetical protein